MIEVARTRSNKKDIVEDSGNPTSTVTTKPKNEGDAVQKFFAGNLNHKRKGAAGFSNHKSCLEKKMVSSNAMNINIICFHHTKLYNFNIYGSYHLLENLRKNSLKN